MRWPAAATLLLAALLLSPLPAGDGRSGNGELDPARVHTRRGEVVVGTLALTEVAIDTDYGVLRVPLAEVRSVAFARLLAAGEREGLERDIASLRASEEEEERAAIRRRIAGLGRPALATLRSARIDGDEEFNRAIDGLIEEIGADEEAHSALDTLVTSRFTIAGRLRLDHLDLRCAYGELRMSRRDLERVVIGEGSGRGVSDTALLLKTWTDPAGEFQNVLQILRSRTRLRLQELETQSAADLARQLRKHGVLVLPEFESGNDALTGLAAQAAGALRRWVMDGGVIVSCGGNWNAQFLTASRLLECACDSNSSEATVVRKHPIVRGVGAIPAANATFPIQVREARKLKALATAQNGGVLVGVASIGSGAVVYCGWDYFASDEPHQKVLANAVLWAAGRLGER